MSPVVEAVEQRDLRAEALYFSDLLRRWRGRIFAGGSEDQDHDHVMFESMLQFLDRVGNMCSAMGASFLEKASLSRFRVDGQAYSAAALLRSWLLAGVTKSDRLLKDAVLRAVQLVMPAGGADMLRSAFEKKTMVLPSASTMSRHRLRIDCAFMLYIRNLVGKRTKAGAVRYLLYDSSPSEYDWEMMEWSEIQAEHIVEAAGILKKLLRKAERIEGGDMNITDEEAAQLSERLASLFDHHMCVPTALGKRRSSLQHKLHGLTHALHMEVGDSHDVQEFCRTVRGTTCDFGTELGLGFTALGADARAPSCMRTSTPAFPTNLLSEALLMRAPRLRRLLMRCSATSSSPTRSSARPCP